MNKREIGREKEKLAVMFLKKQGFKILKTNYYTPFGEIDIIAEKSKCLSIIEVKYRKTVTYQSPLHAITFNKQQRMIKSTQYFLSGSSIDYQAISFDVIAMVQNQPIQFIQNAFRADKSIL